MARHALLMYSCHPSVWLVEAEEHKLRYKGK